MCRQVSNYGKIRLSCSRGIPNKCYAILTVHLPLRSAK